MPRPGDDRSRRSALRLIAGGTVAALAGCIDDRPVESRTASDAPRTGTPSTDAPTPIPSTDGSPIDLTEITAESGLLDPLKGMKVHATAAADVTGNGYLDLFVGTYASRPREHYLERGATEIASDRLLLGGSDGFRVDPTFPAMHGRSSGAVFTDLDGDGDLELVISRNVKVPPDALADDVDPGVDHLLDNGAYDPDDQRTVVLTPTDAASHEGPGYTEAASLDGLTDVGRIRGRTVVPFDYDGDGRTDLFVVGDHLRSLHHRTDVHVTPGFSALFRNTGGLEFEEVTAEAGLPAGVTTAGDPFDGVTGLGAVAANFTGDGGPDLFVAGADAEGGSVLGRLFLNDGGTFTEASVPSLRREAAGQAAGVAAADLTGDGRLDLVLGTRAGGSAPVVRVFRNRGVTVTGQSFEDVTTGASIPDVPAEDLDDGLVGFSANVQLADLDDDGRPDVVTSVSAGDGTRPLVLRHTGVAGGNPQFEPVGAVGAERSVADGPWKGDGGGGSLRRWPVGTAGDFDRDGSVEVFSGEWLPSLPPRLHRNAGETGNWIAVAVTPHARGLGGVVDCFEVGGLGNDADRIGTRPITAVAGRASGVPPGARFGVGNARTVDLRIRLAHGMQVDRSGVAVNQHVVIDADGRPT